MLNLQCRTEHFVALAADDAALARLLNSSAQPAEACGAEFRQKNGVIASPVWAPGPMLPNTARLPPRPSWIISMARIVCQGRRQSAWRFPCGSVPFNSPWRSAARRRWLAGEAPLIALVRRRANGVVPKRVASL